MQDSSLRVNIAEFETRLTKQLKEGDFQEAESLIEALPDDTQALVISRLSQRTQQQLLKGLQPSASADLLQALPEVQAVDLLAHLPAKTAARILPELPKDQQADLVGDISNEQATAIFAEMEDDESVRAVQTLVAYQDDAAGGLMNAEYLSFQTEENVGCLIDHLREHARRYSDYDIQYAYVSDQSTRLVGVLRLRDLLLAPPSTKLSEIMIANPLSVNDRTSLRDLSDFFDQHRFLGVPVTNDAGTLVGVVSRVAVEEALADQNADDYRKAQGIIREELRTMPLITRSRRRLAWLSINIVLNIFAAGVIAAFQDTLAQVIALAVFLPIISDMSGCSGNQAVAVSMRELTLGLLTPRELLRVWLKEISVGLINGLALGLLVASAAFLWKGNIALGLVVGAALAANTMVAVSIGGILPLVMRRFKLDPALASGPILTTITDMCGFLILLGLAATMIRWIS